MRTSNTISSRAGISLNFESDVDLTDLARRVRPVAPVRRGGRLPAARPAPSAAVQNPSHGSDDGLVVRPGRVDRVRNEDTAQIIINHDM